MSIRFKFRSSAIFDSVDLEGRQSISVRELRLKIIRNKNLNICQDFDLVFSDSVTGEEYDDDNFQIPSGACIIVKRVPAGTVPSANAVPPAMISDLTKQGRDCLNPLVLCESDHERIKRNSCVDFDGAGLPGSRFDCQNHESSDLSQAIYKGSDDHLRERDVVQARAEGKKFEKGHADLPVELKCPLCNTFFKEAVLIPCCQHSFCKKCISNNLLEKKVCPICSSTKCSVDDLLPNLSLRQAIEHFLGSRSPNNLCQLVPDGQSGIHAREISCAITVIQREPEMPHSPSATGHGSNQVLTDTFYAPLRRSTLQNMHGVAADGGDQLLNLCNTHVHDEAESTMKRNERPYVRTGGLQTKCWATGRLKQVGRTCYICGSPEHLMKECPSNCHLMPPSGNHMPMGGMPGYASPYWNSTMYSPFAHMYGNPGMMPFNPAVIPTANFGASPYMPMMHSGIPFNEVVRKDSSIAYLAGNHAEQLLHQHECLPNSDKFRGRHCDDKYEKERLQYKHPIDRQASASNSDDSFDRRSKRKHHHVDRKCDKSPHSFSAGRDKSLLHAERSKSCFEDKREYRHSRDTRKHYERRGHSGSDSSWGQHHHVPKDESERDSSHNYRHHDKHHRNELLDERKEMFDGLYGDCRADYSHHKRKRA
ncbi:unnamed protein product [Cuscuta epithymum]|uniref:Uncharacterized protein n=1 Tax=Cuscuta epithymum TaxID=186058 RepID=A0AAV0DTX5_9ASTE|nr:unnamed protein product [Cuscuta epithymum]